MNMAKQLKYPDRVRPPRGDIWEDNRTGKKKIKKDNNNLNQFFKCCHPKGMDFFYNNTIILQRQRIKLTKITWAGFELLTTGAASRNKDHWPCGSPLKTNFLDVPCLRLISVSWYQLRVALLSSFFAQGYMIRWTNIIWS